MRKTKAVLKAAIAAALLFFTMNCLAPSDSASMSYTGAPTYASKTKGGGLPKVKSKFKIPKAPKKPPKYPKGPKVPKVKKLP